MLLTLKNTKTMKSQKHGYTTAILHLSHDNTGSPNGESVCPASTPGCRAACLDTAGHGRFANVIAARKRRTHLFFENRTSFIEELVDEIKALHKKHPKLAVRLNGTSDLPWWRYAYMDFRNLHEDGVIFYDYTKVYNYIGNRPLWWHLTFSASERNHYLCNSLLARNLCNIAVPFMLGQDEPFPGFYWGHRVIDGDETDMRWLDPSPCVVGLRVKGRGMQDTTGFIHPIEDTINEAY